jgi:hypothetical protein
MCFAARLARQKIALGRHRFYRAKSGFDQCNASIVSQARYQRAPTHRGWQV